MGTMMTQHTETNTSTKYDGSYVEDHCPECGEYASECYCDDRAEIEDRETH